MALTLVLALSVTLVRAQDARKDAADKAEREARNRRAAEDDAIKKIAAEREIRRAEVAKQAAADKAKKEQAAAAKLDDDAVRAKLGAKTSINADKLALKEFVAQLAKMHEVPIRLDEAALKKAEVAVDAPVTVFFTNLTLERTLKLALKDLGLKHVDLSVDDGALVVVAAKSRDEADAQPQPAARKAVRVVRPAIAVAGVDQQAQQFAQQFRPILMAELHFIGKVCRPTPEQMQGISQQGEKVLQTAAVQFADLQRGVPRRKVAGQLAISANTEPHALIRETLAAAAKVQLSDEQMARLEAENEQRKREHVDTIVRSLVARIDQELFLSDQQRDEISESLRTNWHDSWCPSIEMGLFNDTAFPNIPDKYVVKFLTDAQKKIYRVMPKTQMAAVANWGGNILRMMPNDDKLWEDEEPEK